MNTPNFDPEESLRRNRHPRGPRGRGPRGFDPRMQAQAEAFGFGYDFTGQADGRRRPGRAEREAFGFGPDAGFGPRFGPGPGGPRRGRGRGRRGDIRTSILLLLSERPMHGYEMIQELAERTGGLWKPSPGSIYPTLQLLVDEGLIAEKESDGGRKLFDITDEGREAVTAVATPPWEQISGSVDPNRASLMIAMKQLAGAVKQSAMTATPEQLTRILGVVNEARREVYAILGEPVTAETGETSDKTE